LFSLRRGRRRWRAGGKVTTLAGMVLDGSIDQIEAPPTADPLADPDEDRVKNEVPESLVDFLEFYLLNYFACNLRPNGDYGEGLSSVSAHPL
jgi:hypothetical protein